MILRRIKFALVGKEFVQARQTRFLTLLEHWHQTILILLYFTIPKRHFIIISSHFTIPPTSQNSIFIKILFFNLSLLFFSNQNFCFPRLSNNLFFFLSFSLNLWHRINTQNPHTDPWYTNQPIQTHHHSPTHTHTHIRKNTKTHRNKHKHRAPSNLKNPETHRNKHKQKSTQTHTHTHHQTLKS